MKSLLIVAFVLIMSVLASADEKPAQPQPGPCDIPQMRQFDFWVGQWDLTWTDSGSGTNTITRELGDCVIEENFSTSDGSFIGNSLSTYDRRSGKWKQTWVDNSGAYLDFEGGWEGNRMILSRSVKDKEGKEFLQRMVWYNITPNSLDWNWEKSTDNGQTWQLNWQIHYQRK